MRNYAIGLILVIVFSACKEKSKQTEQNNPKQQADRNDHTQIKKQDNRAARFAKSISKTHHVDRFKDESAVSFHLDIKFNGEQRMDATITMTTDGAQIKVEKADGTTLFYGPDGVFLSPKENEYDGARFDALTWAYFFALPFKLNDPGTHWSGKKVRLLNGEEYASAKLTFDDHVGDSPDDWYIVYAAQKTNFLKAAAYIVTLGKTVQKARQNPHAIVYDHFITVNSIPIAQQWDFYHWSENKGIHGQKIGHAELSQIKYLKPVQNHFKHPKNAVKINKPSL